jgi:hypothetical protein
VLAGAGANRRASRHSSSTWPLPTISDTQEFCACPFSLR